MKRLLLLFLSLIFINSFLFSQDLMIMQNGDDIECVVTKVGVDEIEYKKFSNQEGPTYTVLKKDVFLIKYKNGEKDVFNERSQIQEPVNEEPQKEIINTDNSSSNVNDMLSTSSEDIEAINYGKSIISINTVHLFYGYISVNFEYISENGIFGFKLPISISFQDSDETLFNIYEFPGVLFGQGGTYIDLINGVDIDGSNGFGMGNFYTGLDFKIYPTGQGHVNAFIGPSLGLTQHNYSNYYYYGYNPEVAFTLASNAGVSFNPSRFFNITLDGSIGIEYVTKTGDVFQFFRMGLTMGVRL